MRVIRAGDLVRVGCSRVHRCSLTMPLVRESCVRISIPVITNPLSFFLKEPHLPFGWVKHRQRVTCNDRDFRGLNRKHLPVDQSI